MEILLKDALCQWPPSAQESRALLLLLLLAAERQVGPNLHAEFGAFDGDALETTLEGSTQYPPLGAAPSRAAPLAGPARAPRKKSLPSGAEEAKESSELMVGC